MDACPAMGVVIVGDELLSGKRQDRHLPHLIRRLAGRGTQVVWCRYVGDDVENLAEALRQTQLDEVPVLCFGGIGATPDDQTRQAAALAFGTRLALHPGAKDMIEEEFGAEAYPNRIRMAELPEDCILIPNRYNNIPGFTLYDHHFLPGFPRIAWPMLEWVLATYYPVTGEKNTERSVQIRGSFESSLLELMESLDLKHKQAKLFSLPHIGADRYIELGFRGRRPFVDAAFADLVAELSARKLLFEFENSR